MFSDHLGWRPWPVTTKTKVFSLRQIWRPLVKNATAEWITSRPNHIVFWVWHVTSPHSTVHIVYNWLPKEKKLGLIDCGKHQTGSCAYHAVNYFLTFMRSYSSFVLYGILSPSTAAAETAGLLSINTWHFLSAELGTLSLQTSGAATPHISRLG